MYCFFCGGAPSEVWHCGRIKYFMFNCISTIMTNDNVSGQILDSFSSRMQYMFYLMKAWKCDLYWFLSMFWCNQCFFFRWIILLWQAVAMVKTLATTQELGLMSAQMKDSSFKFRNRENIIPSRVAPSCTWISVVLHESKVKYIEKFQHLVWQYL